VAFTTGYKVDPWNWWSRRNYEVEDGYTGIPLACAAVVSFDHEIWRKLKDGGCYVHQPNGEKNAATLLSQTHART